MTLLIIGLVLWWVPHLFKRLMPGLRARLGAPFKGVVAVAIFASLAAMIFGYRGADFIAVWSPPAWGVHLNNLLMLVSVFLFGLGNSKSRLSGQLRHPMLTGAAVWAVAHLLVNGDLASMVLFGGIGLWAVLEMLVINGSEPVWERKSGGSVKGDLRLGAITVIVFGVVAAIHMFVGPSPFPG